MDPFTSKTDYNLNSPHKINTPTKMVSRIRENQNWRIILCYKRDVTSNSKKEHSYHLKEFVFWENLSSELGSS